MRKSRFHKIQNKSWGLDWGATVLPGDKVKFQVWAPRSQQVEVEAHTRNSVLTRPMKLSKNGVFEIELEGIAPGDSYFYVLDQSRKRPDPCSRFQPEGVHGASCVVKPESFSWTDQKWKGIPFREFIFYELHVATFTDEGTFESAITKIPHLKKLGVTCVEVMPIAQFPGKRNWGYDGVGLYAVQNSYGGPLGFKKFVNACHRQGLVVCLDVVYNHLGPEGSYLQDYGPYSTKHYSTPWGDALNYDGPESDFVREYVLNNALFWITEYHVDALRLDAIQGIYDFSAKHLLEEMQERVQALSRHLGRPLFLIAESDLNDSRILRSVKKGGYALEAQWADDFHHAVHALLTRETRGYYQDYGTLADLATALKNNFIYDGKYSNYRKKRFGNKASDLPKEKFVVCVQNHDQVGNRAHGDRLFTMIPEEKLKLAAAISLLSPFTPMLFMGEEYGETAPFPYFVDHGDPELIRLVNEGRKKELQTAGWKDCPSPGDPKTFESARLQWDLLKRPKHESLWQWYRQCITFRKTHLKKAKLKNISFNETGKWLLMEYAAPLKTSPIGILFSFSETDQTLDLAALKIKQFQILFSSTKKTQSSKNKQVHLPAHTVLVAEVKPC